MKRALVLGASTLGLALFVSGAQAQPHGHPKPPPAAFTACEGLEAGADCTVTFRDRTIEGVCEKEDQDALFCMPNEMPEPPRGERPEGPPPR